MPVGLDMPERAYPVRFFGDCAHDLGAMAAGISAFEIAGNASCMTLLTRHTDGGDGTPASLFLSGPFLIAGVD